MTTPEPFARLQTSALALALAATVTPLSVRAQPATIASPIYCIIIRDGQGHPIDTVCVPGLPGAVGDPALKGRLRHGAGPVDYPAMA